MRIARLGWNLLLGLLAVGATVTLLPKVRAQYTASDHPLVRLRVLDGVGLWLLVVLALASLATWTWRPVGGRVRGVVAGLLVLAVAGAAAYVVRDEQLSGMRRVGAVVPFVVGATLVAAPLVIAGRGYPGLVVALASRRGRRSAASSTD